MVLTFIMGKTSTFLSCSTEEIEWINYDIILILGWTIRNLLVVHLQNTGFMWILDIRFMLSLYLKNVDCEVWLDKMVSVECKRFHHNDMVWCQWCMREVTCDQSGPQPIASAVSEALQGFLTHEKKLDSQNPGMSFFFLFFSYTYSHQIRICQDVFLANVFLA